MHPSRAPQSTKVLIQIICGGGQEHGKLRRLLASREQERDQGGEERGEREEGRKDIDMETATGCEKV